MATQDTDLCSPFEQTKKTRHYKGRTTVLGMCLGTIWFEHVRTIAFIFSR
jgi:hypothetical protein